MVTTLAYLPGLAGSWLFDDYPNIVDNVGVQPRDASIASLVRAALSSPSSEFKRPLASLTFAVNYLISGLDPSWMKLTNVIIHLINGVLVFFLSRSLFRALPNRIDRASTLASLVAGSWMLLPINLTGVLYVVQRMESLANLFVLGGLLAYVTARRRTSGETHWAGGERPPPSTSGLFLTAASLVLFTSLGLLAKETAAMLPFYAVLVEWVLFGFKTADGHRDWRIITMFTCVLVIPMVAGLAWLLPGVLSQEAWARRDFTMYTRVLSEARIVIDYLIWTLLPLPSELSFYHDDFIPSSGLVRPWTTLASFIAMALLLVWAFRHRRQHPIPSLGVFLFFGAQLLTGTILPLELIYEHRNYFASFGLLLATVPWLAATRLQPISEDPSVQRLFMALPRRVLLVSLILWWATQTAQTSIAWGNPLRLAQELAARAPLSPRAQYELGRTYIIYSGYDPSSPFTQLAYTSLERAAALPRSSILPQQALIFMTSRLHLRAKDAWWDSMISKLKSRTPGVQDESSLSALTQCARERLCDLPKGKMIDAFLAALSHPNPSARLLATYGDYAWNLLGDHRLGLEMATEAANLAPNEPAYQVTLARMFISQNEMSAAKASISRLEALNVAGSLTSTIDDLNGLITQQSKLTTSRSSY